MALLSRFGRSLTWAFRIGFVAIVIQAGLPAAVTPPRAEEVEAVFILNLTRFVRWPETAFDSWDAPLVIGTYANERIGNLVADAARGETSNGHPITVRPVRAAADLEGCHLVYFGTSDVAQLNPLLALLRTRSVLTVSAADGFLRVGGQVEFFTRGGQMRLRVNVRNLKRANLAASAALLRVAEVAGN